MHLIILYLIINIINHPCHISMSISRTNFRLTASRQQTLRNSCSMGLNSRDRACWRQIAEINVENKTLHVFAFMVFAAYVSKHVRTFVRVLQKPITLSHYCVQQLTRQGLLNTLYKTTKSWVSKTTSLSLTRTCPTWPSACIKTTQSCSPERPMGASSGRTPRACTASTTPRRGVPWPGRSQVDQEMMNR